LKLIGVGEIDCLLEGGWNKEICFFVNDRLVLEVFSAPGESLDALGSLFVLVESVRIDAVLVVYTAIPLGNTDEFGTSLCEVL